MSDRYFSPDSVFWRVNREGLLGLAGPRALLLELAHPLIAEGVAQYSNFRHNPWGRLYRTLRAMTAINFLSFSQAHTGLAHVHRCHARVQGHLAEDVGPYPAGTPYDAGDAFLQLWVLATLLDSVLVTHELLIRPLAWVEKEAYYADGRQLARAFGLPREIVPPNYEAFQSYMDSMLNSDLLTVGRTGREMSAALFAQPVLGRAVRLASFVSVGLLPERLRGEFGLRWTERDERRLLRLAGLTRRVRRLAPDPLCVNPQALLAEWQLRRARAAN